MQASPSVSECLPSPSPAVSVHAAPALKPYTHLFQLTWQAPAAKPSPWLYAIRLLRHLAFGKSPVFSSMWMHFPILLLFSSFLPYNKKNTDQSQHVWSAKADKTWLPPPSRAVQVLEIPLTVHKMKTWHFGIFFPPGALPRILLAVTPVGCRHCCPKSLQEPWQNSFVFKTQTQLYYPNPLVFQSAFGIYFPQQLSTEMTSTSWSQPALGSPRCPNCPALPHQPTHTPPHPPPSQLPSSSSAQPLRLGGVEVCGLRADPGIIVRLVCCLLGKTIGQANIRACLPQELSLQIRTEAYCQDYIEEKMCYRGNLWKSSWISGLKSLFCKTFSLCCAFCSSLKDDAEQVSVSQTALPEFYTVPQIYSVQLLLLELWHLSFSFQT